MADDRQEARKAAVAAMWEEARPRIMDRVAVLRAAAAAALDGGLDATPRREAEGEAHKLAGSLGMFGFGEGGDVAREIEELIDGDGPFDTARFAALVDRLVGELPS
jgi:hypothetical protein